MNPDADPAWQITILFPFEMNFETLHLPALSDHAFFNNVASVVPSFVYKNW